MKFTNRFSFLLFSLLVGIKFAGGQDTMDSLRNDSAVFFVEYASYDNYTNDTNYSTLHKSFLFLGKKAGICIYQRKTVEEFLDNMSKKIDVSGKGNNKKELIQSFQQQFDVEKMVSLIYARYYNSPLFFEHKELDKKDLWIVDTAMFKWNLINEFKYIHQYRCQRADRKNVEGELITAWFTEQIPISAGPFYLSGLPGLILETSNPNQKHLTRAITISSENIPDQRFRKWLTGSIVTKAEYADLYFNGSKKFDQMKRMVETNKD